MEQLSSGYNIIIQLYEVLCQNQAHVARYNFEKMAKNDRQDQIKILCFEFESNSCSIIITSSKEIVFGKFLCFKIALLYKITETSILNATLRMQRAAGQFVSGAQ